MAKSKSQVDDWQEVEADDWQEANDWQESTPPKAQQGLLSKGLNVAGRVLDYPGGLARVSAAGLLNIPYAIATGKSFVQPDDVKQALLGNAPTSSTFLERAGVPEGPQVDLNPFVEGSTPTRDIVGFGSDIALDPLAASSKMIKPIKGGLESLGKSAYRSGLKKIDERLVEKGVKPLADLLIEKGAPVGTTKTLAKKTSEIGQDLLTKRAALYDEATELGAKVDLQEATKGAEAAIEKMRSDPGMAPVAEKLSEMLQRYREQGVTDVATASEWKTNLYNALPETAYDQFGKLKAPVAKFQKQLASDFKNAIVKGADNVKKGLGKNINEINENLATTISAGKPLKMQIRRGTTPNALTSVDAMLATIGSVAADPVTAGGLLAAKKAADLSKTTAARTAVGKGLLKASGVPLIDQIALRGLINESKDE